MKEVFCLFREKSTGELWTVIEDSNNLPMAKAKARNDLFLWCKKHERDYLGYEMIGCDFLDTKEKKAEAVKYESERIQSIITEFLQDCSRKY